MKHAIALLAFLGAVGPMQAAPEPPPEVDQALRSRVTLFYQAHVDGKARRADAVVAEDSKDVFFERAKPRYYSFSIRSIAYSEDFTKATVTVECEEDVAMGVPGHKVRTKLPQPSLWKLENGEWFWYVDTAAVRQTPFGQVKMGRAEAGSPRTPITVLTAPPPGALDNKVELDKRVVALSATQPSTETVTVTSGMSGWVSLRLQQPNRPGLSLALDRTSLAPNQSAKLTLSYQPQAGAAAPQPLTVQLMVEPLGTILPVKVQFQQ